jgi:carbamoyl-phosphate synthase large subunit
MGFELFATEGTSDFLNENGVKNMKLYKVSTGKSPNIIDYIGDKKLDLVIDIPKNYTRQEITDGYIIRRKAIDMNIPLMTNLQVAKLLTEALKHYKTEDLEIKSWDEYVK